MFYAQLIHLLRACFSKTAVILAVLTFQTSRFMQFKCTTKVTEQTPFCIHQLLDSAYIDSQLNE